MAINLQIVFLMRFFLGFSLNLRPTHFGRANEMRFRHKVTDRFQRLDSSRSQSVLDLGNQSPSN